MSAVQLKVPMRQAIVWFPRPLYIGSRHTTGERADAAERMGRHYAERSLAVRFSEERDTKIQILV